MEAIALHLETAVPAGAAPFPRPLFRCEACGGDCDGGFEVVLDGQAHRFDRFACAVAALAPRCEHCGRGILGHGPEASGHTFCCDRCAGGQRSDPLAGARPSAGNLVSRAANPPSLPGPLPARVRSIQARATGQTAPPAP